MHLDSNFTLHFWSGSWNYLRCTSVIIFSVVIISLISDQGCAAVCFLFVLVLSLLLIAVVHPMRYSEGPVTLWFLVNIIYAPFLQKCYPMYASLICQYSFSTLHINGNDALFLKRASEWNSSEHLCVIASDSFWAVSKATARAEYSLFSNVFMLCLDHEGHIHASPKLWLIYI